MVSGKKYFQLKVWVKKLKNLFQMDENSPFQGIKVKQRTPSGRVATLEVRFKNQPVKILTAQSLRRILGFRQIKSTNFAIHWDIDKVKIQGRGNGHGVGLCQWGARQLALRGLKHQDILKHYYPRTKLK